MFLGKSILKPEGMLSTKAMGWKRAWYFKEQGSSSDEHKVRKGAQGGREGSSETSGVLWSSLVAQWAKDPVLLLPWFMWLDLWSRNSHMIQAQLERK